MKVYFQRKWPLGECLSGGNGHLGRWYHTVWNTVQDKILMMTATKLNTKV